MKTMNGAWSRTGKVDAETLVLDGRPTNSVSPVEELTHSGEGVRPTKLAALKAVGPAVYAVHTADGLIKIGHTTDLSVRLRYYRKPAQLLAIMPGTQADEAQLHARFAAKRAKGRGYYHQHPELVAWINTLRAPLGLPLI